MEEIRKEVRRANSIISILMLYISINLDLHEHFDSIFIGFTISILLYIFLITVLEYFIEKIILRKNNIIPKNDNISYHQYIIYKYSTDNNKPPVKRIIMGWAFVGVIIILLWLLASANGMSAETSIKIKTLSVVYVIFLIPLSFIEAFVPQRILEKHQQMLDDLEK